ncbi:MAG: hypothetical protein ACRC2T_18240, partial [Thermoguttaceae bacterium]
FIAIVENISPNGITTNTICDKLTAWSFPSDKVFEIKNLLGALDAARFGPQTAEQLQLLAKQSPAALDLLVKSLPNLKKHI